jgi:hypothetical protein
MYKNRIEGAAEQGEQAKNREALVIKARRRRSVDPIGQPYVSQRTDRRRQNCDYPRSP